MDKEQKKLRVKYALNGIGILLGIFALYTFIEISELQLWKKAILCLIAIGWILSGVSGILNAASADKKKRQE